MIEDDTRQADDRKRQQMAAKQFRSDVQAVFGTAPGRRVLWAFLTDAGYDTTAFSANPTELAHNVGIRDAGDWWINAIRRHCPEREALMRNESREAARSVPQDNSDD